MELENKSIIEEKNIPFYDRLFVKAIKERYNALLDLPGGVKSNTLENFAKLAGFPHGKLLLQTKESVEDFFSTYYTSRYYSVFADEGDDPREEAELRYGEEPNANAYEYGEDWEKAVEDYESAIKEHIETFPERLRNKRLVGDILKLSPEEYVRRVEDEITHIAQERINDYPSRFKDDISSDVKNYKELPFIGDFKNALYDNLRDAHINQVNESGFNPRLIRKGPMLSQDVIDKKMLNILDDYESNPLHKNSVSAIKKRFVISGEKDDRKILKRVPLAKRLRGLVSDGLSSLSENALQPVTIKDIEDVISQVEEPRKVFVTGWCKEDEDFIVKTVNDCTENLKAGLVHVALPLEDKAFRYNETVEFLTGQLHEYNFIKKQAYDNFSEQLKNVTENPETYTKELFSFAKKHLEFIHNARIDKAQRNLEVMADFAHSHGCPSNKMHHEAAMMAKTDTPEEREALRRFKEAHNLNSAGVKKPIVADTSQEKREAVILPASDGKISKSTDSSLLFTLEELHSFGTTVTDSAQIPEIRNGRCHYTLDQTSFPVQHPAEYAKVQAYLKDENLRKVPMKDLIEKAKAEVKAEKVRGMVMHGPENGLRKGKGMK